MLGSVPAEKSLELTATSQKKNFYFGKSKPFYGEGCEGVVSSYLVARWHIEMCNSSIRPTPASFQGVAPAQLIGTAVAPSADAL